jgi:cytochrome c
MRCFPAVLLLLIAVLVQGCNGGDPEQMKRELAASMSNKKASSAQAYYDRSVELARMNGCWNCHHVDNDLIGPAWRRVSERYKDDPNARAWLIEKVKHGGSGVWNSSTSDAVMPPNSPRVSDQDIGELVDFILSLAKGGMRPDQHGGQ